MREELLERIEAQTKQTNAMLTEFKETVESALLILELVGDKAMEKVEEWKGKIAKFGESIQRVEAALTEINSKLK